MPRTKTIAARMDTRILTELKKIFPKQTPSRILRLLAEERIAVQRNTDNLYAARHAVEGRKSDREFL